MDAVNGDSQLDLYEQSVKQAAVADSLVFTKTGLAGPAKTLSLVDRVRVINPLAPLWYSDHDDIDADILLCTELLDVSRKTEAARQWLAAEFAPPSLLSPRPQVGGPAQMYLQPLPPKDHYLERQRRVTPRHDADIRWRARQSPRIEYGTAYGLLARVGFAVQHFDSREAHQLAAGV